MSSPRSVKSAPTLDLGEFVLRPLRPSDSGPWFDYLRDPRTIEHTSWPEVSAETVAAIVDRLIGEYEAGTSLRLGLASRNGDELIGTCGFTRIDSGTGVAELAYDLAPACWGRGIMRAAVNAVVKHAFENSGLRRIEALVMVSNSRSMSLLERCGFTREQLLPGHRLARGEPRDFWRYAREADRGRPAV